MAGNAGQMESTIRGEWLQQITRQCQEFAGLLLPDADVPGADATSRFVATLPSPVGPAEEMTVKTMLLDLALRIAGPAGAGGLEGWRARHTALGTSADREFVEPGWTADCQARWAALLVGAVEAWRQRSAALRAACLMEQRYAARWTLSSLAGALGVSGEHLLRTFRRCYSVTPREYLARVRVGQAIGRLLEGHSLERLAGDVGYRSRRNLTGALAKHAKLSPSQIRALPAADAQMLRRRLMPRYSQASVHRSSHGSADQLHPAVAAARAPYNSYP